MSSSFIGARVHALLPFLVSFLLAVLPSAAFAQVCEGGLCWTVGSTRPNFMVGFTAANNTYINHDNNSLRYTTNFGTDAHNPDKIQSPSELWVLHPNRDRPTKVFPLASHRIAGLIDAHESHGAVIEPNASLDGNSILFSYVHDARQGYHQVNQFGQSPLGADLYKIDLAPMRNNPNIDPSTLQVTRLTTPPANVNQHAFNPGLASAMSWTYTRPFNMHAIEVMTDQGLRVIFVSDRGHVQSSNHGATNFNLFSAKYGSQGRLEDITQFLHYTTTSALSPANTRNGFAFSYLASTEDSRYWAIQHSDSAGKWTPLQGFGRFGFAAFHLGTLCRTTSQDGDFWFSSVYYPNKNNGFGGVLGIPMAFAGLNHTFTGGGPGSLNVPEQVGEFLLTTQVEWNQDKPAVMSSPGNYVGKVTAIRCAGVNQMILSHSKTIAHNVYSGIPGQDPPPYDARLVFRNEILTPASPDNEAVYRVLLDETTMTKSLLWATPMLSFQERFGTDPVVETTISNISGMPEALVGTSALHHTDVAPRECRLPNGRFDPHQLSGEPVFNSTIRNVAALSWVRDNNPANLTQVCNTPLLPPDVLGVAIQITDNKTDRSALNPIPGRKEGARTLGVVRTSAQMNGGARDNSFKALIPANVPFEFHLLHARYGLRMADVRSWHSLKAGEVRVDCGGCHKHEFSVAPVPWNGTLAAQSSYPTPDLLATTPVIEYDSNCQPQLVVKNTPSEPIQVWGDGRPLYTKFVANCASCHSPGQSGQNAFIVGGNAQQTYSNLLNGTRKYLNGDEGALGSPAFWAARGERTDGRNNASSYFTPQFRYSNVHSSLNLCASGDNWVYQFGQWIDNHMPVDWLFPVNPAEMDRYLPTGHITLASRPSCNPTGGAKVGVWDDRGTIASITVRVNDVVRGQLSNVANGVHTFTGLGLANSSDKISLEVVDPTGNRYLQATTVEELVHECQTGADPRNGVVLAPPPTPTPTGTPTLSPSPTPTPSPTPPGGGGSQSLTGGGAFLTLTPSRAREGTLVKVKIDAPDFPGAEAVLYGSFDHEGSAQLQGTNGVLQLSLGSDGYFGSMANSRRVRLDSRGRGIAWVSIPTELSQSASVISYIAVIFEANSSIIRASTPEKFLRVRARNRPNVTDLTERKLAKLEGTLLRLEADIERLTLRRSGSAVGSRRYQVLTARITRASGKLALARAEYEHVLEAREKQTFF